MEDLDERERDRQQPRADALVRMADASERWRAALWFWAAVLFTTALGLWWLVESRHSWPH